MPGLTYPTTWPIPGTDARVTASPDGCGGEAPPQPTTAAAAMTDVPTRLVQAVIPADDLIARSARSESRCRDAMR